MIPIKKIPMKKILMKKIRKFLELGLKSDPGSSRFNYSYKKNKFFNFDF